MSGAANNSSWTENSKTILRVARGKRKNFSMLGNAMLQNPKLRNDALGVLVFILSHPEDWHFEVEWLCRERKLGRDKAKRVIAEIISAGYCHRVRPRNADGTLGPYEYVFSDDPETIADLATSRKPVTGQATVVEPASGPPGPGRPAPGKPVDYNKEDSSTKKQTNSESDFDLEGKGVRARLRHHFSEHIFASWFAGVAFSHQAATAIAETTSKIVRDWLQKQYEPDLLAACKAEWPDVTTIKIVSNDNAAGAGGRIAR